MALKHYSCLFIFAAFPNMFMKLILMAGLFLTTLGAHAQLEAEHKALRVFTNRILRQVNVRKFYKNNSATTIYFDGTVAPYPMGGWYSPSWYKDVRGVSRKHWIMSYSNPGTSIRARERLKIRRSRRFKAYQDDFDSIIPGEEEKQHDLRQRDSLSIERLPILAPLRRIHSADYQHLPSDHPIGAYYLTVHRAAIGRRYVAVGLMLGRTSCCYNINNMPVVVLLSKRNLHLVDWWYIDARPKD